MDYTYNPYFSTQSEVIYELVKVLRMHSKGKISHAELEDLVERYVEDYSNFIFDFNGDKVQFKGFPKQKLGKKRIRIIGMCLEKRNLISNFDVERAEFVSNRFFDNIA